MSLASSVRVVFHAFVRITPGHEKTGTVTGRFLPHPAIYAVYSTRSAARSSDILRGSYRRSPQSPASSQTAPFQTPRYHTTTGPCVSRGFSKIFGRFLKEEGGFFVRFAIADRRGGQSLPSQREVAFAKQMTEGFPLLKCIFLSGAPHPASPGAPPFAKGALCLLHVPIVQPSGKIVGLVSAPV